jgi:ABC-type antimicrobial peptide transport system permease subunit
MQASQKAMTQSMNVITQAIAAQISQSFAKIMKNPANLMSIDPTALGKSLKMNLNEDDLKSLMSSLMNAQGTTYEDNLKSLGYVTKEDLNEIVIYPKNFDDKKNMEKMITNYNKKMEAKGLKKRTISYTDTMGLILKNFTTMVNTISMVLVALVAISLIVSSIMIGVITYISVLERRKEIGILRSIGASRRNVAEVFNAETVITGALSGVIGIGVAEALMPFMTKLVQSLSKRPDLTMHLPVTYALALIGISIVLTFIGGLIPSSKASHSDPVTALRSSD